MAYEVASIFTLKDNFTSHLKNMIGAQKEFKADSQLLSKQLGTTYGKLKEESKTAGAALVKAQKEAQKEFKNTGKISDETRKKIRDAVSQKVKIQFDIESIKNADKEIKKLEKDMKNLSNKKISPTVSSPTGSSSNFGRNMVGFIGGLGLVGAGVGAVYGVGRGALSALNFSGEMEQTEIAFETMLKSREAGQKMIKDLKKFAVETPFEFKDLAKNTQYALAMGFKQNDMLSLLTDVGDAAAGTGRGVEGVENIIRALGQMQQKGKVSAQEINQLAENGIGAWKYLAKAINKTEAETMKLAENGLLPAEKAIKAIRKGMREDYGGMMIRQSKTLLGLLSSAKDFLQLNVIGAFGDGIRQGVQGPLADFVDKLTKNEKGLENLQKKLTDVGRTIGTFISDKASKLVKYFEELFNNPKFQNADLGGKVKIVLDDMYKNFKEWFDGEGGKKISGTMEFFTRKAMDALVLVATDFVPKFADIGIKIGNAMAEGILSAPGKAVSDFMKDNFLDDDYTEKSKNAWKDVVPNKSQQKRMENNPALLQTLLMQNLITKEQAKEKYPAAYQKLTDQGKLPAKAFGMSRVPYDNYPVLLHEGEKVLTKQEANNSSGLKGIIIQKLADQIIVREEADIEKIADVMVRKLQQASNNMGGAVWNFG